MARPQWSRILSSAIDGIADGYHGHKAYQLAGGRVHLWTRVSGKITAATPTYNKIVELIENEFKSKGYTIDAENRKWGVDGPCPQTQSISGRWVTEFHIYLYPPEVC